MTVRSSRRLAATAAGVLVGSVFAVPHALAAPGRQDLHRTYVIEDGNHVDGLYGVFPDRLRPILPCYRDSFAALESWVDGGVPPPASHLVSRPVGGDVVNTCSVR